MILPYHSLIKFDNFTKENFKNIYVNRFDYKTYNYNIYYKMQNFNITFLNYNNLNFHNFFLNFKKRNFIYFFTNNFLDVPRLFKKSKSLKRISFKIPLIKFINFLMRRGLKEKINKTFFNSFFNFFSNLKFDNINFLDLKFDWLKFFFKINIINENFYQLKNYNNFIYENENNGNRYIISFNNYIFKNNKYVNEEFFLLNYLKNKLLAIKPIFSYFIYNVDKNVRKFSRGKSGKYTFIWKYIAPYKRIFITLKWLIKDIRFNTNKTLKARIYDSLSLFFFSFDKTFAWKSKIYLYNNVFKNFKNSLMLNFKTLSK